MGHRCPYASKREAFLPNGDLPVCFHTITMTHTYIYRPNRTTKYCAYSLSIPVSFPIATRCCGRDPSDFEPENLKDL